MLRKMPGIGKYMLSFRTQNFRGWKPPLLCLVSEGKSGSVALQAPFCLKSMGEETQKLVSGNSDPARLMDICAGLTLIVLLHKEGSTYGESYAKRRALGGPWGLHPLLHRCFVPGTSPASLLSHSADSWGVPEAIKLRSFIPRWCRTEEPPTGSCI